MRSRLAALCAAIVVAGSLPAVTAGAHAAAGAGQGALQNAAKPGPKDRFYSYTGKKPLKKIARGTVLKTRTVPYSIQGLPLPLQAVQVLFRTVNQRGLAVVGATSVIRPILPVSPSARVVSYQSFYDSLNPADQPSVAIAGGQGIGPAIANVETAVFAPALLAGFSINIPDTEGQTANFAAGPEYGKVTLDSLKAISRAKVLGLRKAAIGLLGYSGGAIASEWAAELAPTYAPGIAKRIVGTAIGGVLVHPGHNLHYINGSQTWAGVAPMALTGIARSFNVNLKPYLNAKGRTIMKKMQKASIVEVLGAYPGLTWAKITRPKYRVPESVGVYVRLANKLIMGTGGTPNAPMFIGQGTGGELEGTGAHRKYGKGDGVMLAADVRSLARKYCRKGVTVQHREYPLSHFTSVALWLPEAYSWLLARFSGTAAPSNCSSIKPGNSLAPIKKVK